MITSLIADDYGKVLFKENIERNAVDKSMEILNSSSELVCALDNPAVSDSEKHNVIDRIFPEEMRSFIKYVCDNKHICIMNDIYDVYNDLVLENAGGIKAQFICVTEPDKNEAERIKNMIKKKYNRKNVMLEVIKKPELIGGFILKVGDHEYDRSLKGSLNNLVKKLEWR